ncbi:mediator complex, subunit Med5 [Stachybotrys elegans]|uniref:Mediator of RNA polymerase II transcription subunit 5 n=1 Tax=Stachybotrys elegans TaxID=80388 RepID=A0A8K0SWZ2_9HYPO|nr:mediator complex, subunit Med5 [Stachybotrys elegans]
MDSQNAMHEALTAWSNFRDNCQKRRLGFDKFEEMAPRFYDRYHLSPIAIADIFWRPRPPSIHSPDARFPKYMQSLSKHGIIDAPSLLNTLYKYSTCHTLAQTLEASAPGDGEKSKSPDPPIRWQRGSWAEEYLFFHIIKLLVEGQAFRDAHGAIELGNIIAKWVALFAAVPTVFPEELTRDDIAGSVRMVLVRSEADAARTAFQALLFRFFENPDFVKAISSPGAQETRKALCSSIFNYTPTLQNNPQLTEKLLQYRMTLVQLDPPDKTNQAAKTAIDDLLETTVDLDSFIVPDIPTTNTRAGLYIYLNALLVGRPLLDDHVLFSYLNNRYGGDTQSSVVDLILASFDILANAVFGLEPTKDAHLLRSYLINKVPLLLCQMLPPGFPNSTAEMFITMALNQVDTGTFPTASLMFDESRHNNPYTESVREEFCAACALHGLIDRDHVERILGEISMSYEPSLEKYSKEKLVQNCLSDPEKIQGLVRELDKMDGNVGAVCQALVELMRQLCNNKDTMSLKLLCNQLVQKPLSLDVLLLFEKLQTILEPLCRLLDNWRYEEDQGEYQPVYEEFGAVLLLVLTFGYRYNLSPADMGIQSADSCVAKILRTAHISRPLEELSEQENTHMNGWIHGLFDSDAGGLGDDLMSSCPPQDFYLIVSTLFQSTVVAYGNGFLGDENLKSGIEYLVDTFLLPSLVPAIRYLSQALWVDQKDQKSIIKILQLILLPSAISGEASTMLSSVKNVVAKELEHALRSYQRRDPKNQDIEPLLQSLKESLPLSKRTGAAEHNELDTWVANPSHPGMAGSIKNLMSALSQWSQQPALNLTPPTYTHRQLIAARQMMRPSLLLRVILDEVKAQSEAGSASVVYDIATALICAPDVTNEPPAGTPLEVNAGGQAPAPRRLSLRDALRFAAEECKKIKKHDAVLAEHITRLHRKVEAQMALPPPDAMMQDAGLLGRDGTALAGAGVQGDAMEVDNVMGGMGGIPTDLGLGDGMGNGSGSGLDPNGDGDLFAPLDNSMDVFNDWGLDT